MFPEPDFVDVPGARLAYRTWGTGREPLLLIHGITSSSLSWVRVAPALGKRFRVIVPDLKGHGDSEKATSGYRLEDQAAELDALCDRLGLDRVRAIGHSWGGGIGLLLATRSARVSRLVLEDPALYIPDEHRLRAGESYAAQVGLTSQEAEARYRGANARWTREDEDGKIQAAVKGSPNAVRAVFHENAPWDVRRALADLSVPTLMVNATNDLGGIVHPETVRRAEGANVRVVTVPGADHNVHRTEFDAFMNAVEPFLTGE